ncbi:MAG TPA: outer membrane beta-barrel protein [Tepidisphaeraceae bacterium]|nr:outer membrane beta-barrel protein [Tepidisphaeraceae bacterium]
MGTASVGCGSACGCAIEEAPTVNRTNKSEAPAIRRGFGHQDQQSRRLLAGRRHFLGGLFARLVDGVAHDGDLVYVTGGAAWARIATTADEVFLTGVNNPGTLTSTKTGWVFGGGLEYAMTANWIVRGEYLHHQFSGDVFVGPRVPTLPTFSVQYVTNRTNVSVARVGLSYKFGGLWRVR